MRAILECFMGVFHSEDVLSFSLWIDFLQFAHLISIQSSVIQVHTFSRTPFENSLIVPQLGHLNDILFSIFYPLIFYSGSLRRGRKETVDGIFSKSNSSIYPPLGIFFHLKV